MRIFIVALLILLACPITKVSYADEKSDCLNSCANEKRTNDMYCPPAGGFTDEDNKQCQSRNSAEFLRCTNICSPPTPPPAEPQTDATQSTPAQLDEPGSSKKNY